MTALRGKRLWVMRHGRPDLPDNPFFMTRETFNRFLEAYDAAGLSDREKDRLRRLYEGYPRPDLVVTSDLPRARETAELFARSAPIIEDPVFREIPVRLPDVPTWFLSRLWPGEIWWGYLRFAWFYDIPPEGQKKSLERAQTAIGKLEQYQSDVPNLAVVSHSGFLLVLIDQLQRAGRIQGRRLPHIGFGLPTDYIWQ
ncbi:MAG: histidine phosphatase family protein [Sulfobacillus sp.]|nr:histidine phosphatase family protein [Sulfobacillus sp.]